jgi:intracellular septation protein
MKILFDLFPVILFFIAYKFGVARPDDAAAVLAALGIPTPAATGVDGSSKAGIMLATTVAILATFVQIGWQRARHGKVENMLWVSLGIIVIFGGATLWLQDETFIKWKPTVLYWLFACVLVASATWFRKNLIRAMMGAQMELPEPVWSRLNLSWAGFFALLGVLNLWVAFNFSTSAWVDFKLFGTMGLMLVFVVGQVFFLNKYMDKQDSP